MAVPDNDDIVEDYEVEAPGRETGPVRRIESAQGGEVPRPQPEPSKGPSAASLAGAAAAKKGKISHAQAKMIWIVCIAICVLGLGAVAGHYFLIKLPAEKEAAKVQPVKNRPPVRQSRTAEPTEEDLRLRSYTLAVSGFTRELNRSKGWDFFRVAQVRFIEARKKALAEKAKETPTQPELDDAWLEAIRAFQNVNYAMTLFLHLNRPVNTELPSDFMLPSIKDKSEVAKLPAEFMSNPEIQRWQAASELVDGYSSDIKSFRTDSLRYDMTCQRVYMERKADFAAETERLNKAQAEPPEFDPADLEFVKGPPYGPEDEMQWEKVSQELQK